MILIDEIKKTDSPAGRELAESLICRFGRNSFSWQILNSGISLWFSRDEQAVAGYVNHGKMRIVGGVPITPPSNLKRAAIEFEEDARKHGQRVCYFGAEGWLKEIFENQNTHRIVLLGAQPTWNPGLWEKTIAEKPSLRELLSYSARKGVDVEEVSIEQVQSDAEYQRCVSDWLAGRKLPSLQFLINPDVLQNSCGRRFFAAKQKGQLIGFLSLVPIVGRNGCLIEHIFRSRRSIKGMNEYLIDAVMKKLADEGCVYATLGLAPLSKRAGLSYDMNPAWIRIAFDWLYSGASGFYNFSGLDTFKSKFKPHHWEPVYAIVNKSRFSPRTFYKIVSAFCRTSPVLFSVAALTRTFLNWLE